MVENKVANKSIIQLDIETWIPQKEDIVHLDLKLFLFREMILKEKEFRELVEAHSWADYQGKYIILQNSKQAIIPQWAYMIIANKLYEVGGIAFVDEPSVREKILQHIIEHKDLSEYTDKRVLIKGCGNERLSNAPYLLLTHRLSSVVRALSFGESCSMVPLFKN